MPNISEQLDLAAWEHELRDRHGEWTIVGNTAGARAEIGRQLDAQGLDPQSPLRGVLQYNVVGTHSILHRDSQGRIDAGTNYTYQRRLRTQTHNISIGDVRVLPEHHGIGTEMLRQIVRAHPDAKSMAVYGAVESAKPFYAYTGASFYPNSSMGEWDNHAIERLRQPEIALGWRFNPLEARNEHGEWTRSGESYVAPDHNRLIIPHPPKNTRFPYYRAPEDHPFFKAHPVSAANVVKVYDQSTPAERAQGMRWYADAHHIAGLIGQGDVAKGAGALAAYSPQTAWPVNMFNAARAIELGHALGPGDGMITHHMQDNAQEILDGDSPDQVFGKNSAPKIRAFANLIEHGGDPPEERLGNVVIDRHAMSVAIGERLQKKDADQAPIGTNRYYQHVADAYRDAALEINKRGGPQVAPHQLQAITWLHQQAANAAEDEAGGVGHGGKGAGAGRQQMIRNAWSKWGLYAKQHHLDVNPGTTALTGIAGRALEFGGWRDVWRHELRGPHGEWVRGDGATEGMTGEKYPGHFSYQLRSFWRNETDPDAKQHLNLASASFDADDYPETVKQLRLAAKTAASRVWASSYEGLAGQIESSDASDTALHDSTLAFTQKTAKATLKLVGGGTESWNGKVRIAEQFGNPSELAELDWDRNMAIRKDVAQHIQTSMAMTGEPVDDPSSFSVPLHEMIHGIVEKDNRIIEDKDAYQDPANAAIEEGFTELGTIHHAPEYFDAMGIGDRQTQILSDVDGSTIINPDWERAREALHNRLRSEAARLRSDNGPHSPQEWAIVARHVDSAADDIDIGDINDALDELDRLQHLGDKTSADHAMALRKEIHAFAAIPQDQHATMSEYARRLQDPSRIAAGDAWGHYSGQTRAAQEWVQQIAQAEAHAASRGFDARGPDSPDWKRVVELSDEINRVGTAQKLWVMADQVARLHGMETAEELDTEDQDSLIDGIKRGFQDPGDPKGKEAFLNASVAMRNRNQHLSGISAQVLELGWEGWRTEPRDAHGRWTRGGGLTVAAQGGLAAKIGHRAASFLKTGSLEDLPEPASPEIHAFTAKAAAAMPGILGGGTQGFTGKVWVKDKLQTPGSLAQMEWNGDMVLRSDVADTLQKALTSDDPVGAGPVEDVEHELIHGVTATGHYDGDLGENKTAYQDLPTAMIEEGFTELGAIQHAGEFFKAMGLSDHQTPALVDGKHATFDDYAKGASQPKQIMSGVSWGHYGTQVAGAYGWAQQIAQMEGAADEAARIIELSDEINQRGAAGKVDVMAAQVLSAAAREQGGWGNLRITPDVLDAIRTSVRQGFEQGGGTLAASLSTKVAKARLAALAAEQA